MVSFLPLKNADGEDVPGTPLPAAEVYISVEFVAHTNLANCRSAAPLTADN
jgi:hypothetical protein